MLQRVVTKTPRSFLLSAAASDCISTHRPRRPVYTSLNLLDERGTGISPSGTAHSSNRSAIALHSSERFGVRSFDVVHADGIGLAIFVYLHPVTAEMRSRFRGKVDITFAVFRNDGISHRRALP